MSLAGPDDVLLRLNATGICHSDIHFMANDWGSGPMSRFGTRCAGHEGAGVIVKVGDRVKDLQVGQRAGLKPILDTCGTYKQYVCSPVRYTILIPDGVSDHIAGPIICSASAMYTSLKESGLRAGQWAVFPGGGGGGVGIQVIGLRRIVVDTGSAKRELALSLGAEAFVDFKESKDSGIAEVVKLATQRYMGRRAGAAVMCIALPSAGTFDMTIRPAQVVLRNQQVKGTLVSGMADVDETLDFAKRDKFKIKPEVVGLSKFNDVVQRLRKREVAGKVVVDFNME